MKNNVMYPVTPKTAARRWLYSLLATHPGRRLLHTCLITSLALNLAAPVWAESHENSGELKQGTYCVLRIPYSEAVNTQYAIRNTSSIQNPKSKTQNPYTTPAVQNALHQLGLPLPNDQLAVSSEQLAVDHSPPTANRSLLTADRSLLAPDNIPTGSQFQVNSYTTNDQAVADVAIDSDGDFVVVWASEGSSGGDTSSYSIQGQRYNSAGTPQGSQFQVNNYTTGLQDFPKVAIDSDGDFVVVWHSEGSSGGDTSEYSIQARRYNSAGTAQGNQFQVNNYTTDKQLNPDAAMDQDGDFVVVWQSYGSSSGPAGADTSDFSIQGRRYNSAGTAQGSQFQVNSYTTNDQFVPAVSLDDDGDFVITWDSAGSNGGDTDWLSIQGQRYNSVGTAQGSQFQVNTYTTDAQTFSAVSLDSNGDFVVVWTSYGSSGNDTDDWSIQGRRYNAAGTAQGSQFQVNSFAGSNQYYPAVSMDSDGNFVVIWNSQYSNLGDYSGYSILGKQYNSAGTAQSSQFQVNSYTTSNQFNPAVAMDNDGDFVVVWYSNGSSTGVPVDNSGNSIQAQRYLFATPVAPGNFQVNSYTTGNQFYPQVAMDADGDFVVVWRSYGSSFDDTSEFSIQGQRYNAAGTAQGSEFQVNTYTTGQQYYPAVAMDSAGNFVVVWQSEGSPGNDTSGESIQGRLYNSAGTAQGSQFQVNSITTGLQENPGVAMDSSGDFVVVWNSGGIQAQRYNSIGTAQGGQFQINTYTTGYRRFPVVAMDSDGDFVAAWQDYASYSNPSTIQARRYNSAGTAQGSQFLVNSYTIVYPRRPAVDMDSDGDFVVVWGSYGSNGGDSSDSSIQGQRYNSAGTVQGSQFQINSYTTGSQSYPAVSLDNDGDFVVVWSSYGSSGSDTSLWSVQGRIFDRNGLPLLGEFQINAHTPGLQAAGAVAADSDGDFVVAWWSYGSADTDFDGYSIQAARFDLGQLDQQVNTYTTGYQRSPAVATDSNGDFVVVWQSNGSSSGPAGADTSFNSIQGRRYNSSGVPIGDQFQVNSYTTNQQRNPAVAMDSDGDFVVLWQSYGSAGDSNGYSVQAQRYNSAGTAQGSQFQVNSYSTGDQRNPVVAMDSSGNFTVAWESNGSSNGDSLGFSIQQRRFNAAGTPLDPADVRANSYTTNSQRLPAIAAEANGDFAIVWASNGATGDASGYSIQGQRYNSAGTAQGSQFQVNSYTTSNQHFPALAMDPVGGFVVAWQSNGASTGPAGVDTSGYSVQGQRYSSSGAAVGTQFAINNYTTGHQLYPAVALDSTGNFVVVWRSDGSAGGDTSSDSIQSQRYNQHGTAQGSQFQVNTYTTSQQDAPAVAADTSGDLIITWESLGITNLPFLQPLAAAEDLTKGELAPEMDNDYAIVVSRLGSLGAPEPSAVTFQSSNTTLPTRGGLLAAITGLSALLTAGWLAFRQRYRQQ